MMIEPDTKDWTWVLERACEDCGFDAVTVERSRVGALLRENARIWAPLLAHASASERPDEHTWSALEYACHVRDVFRLFEHRLQLMLAEDGAAFPNWDQDATAVDDDYASQDPTIVAEELAAAGAVLADHFDALPDAAWARTGVRSDGARFTIESFSQYLLHDPTHHVWDVRCGHSAIDERR
ncbi:MAG: hypothetical protein QOH79_179 [Acidimicrobiaceae bacterium]|jgi:hypothetical protein